MGILACFAPKVLEPEWKAHAAPRSRVEAVRSQQGAAAAADALATARVAGAALIEKQQKKQLQSPGSPRSPQTEQICAAALQRLSVQRAKTASEAAEHVRLQIHQQLVKMWGEDTALNQLYQQQQQPKDGVARARLSLPGILHASASPSCASPAEPLTPTPRARVTAPAAAAETAAAAPVKVAAEPAIAEVEATAAAEEQEEQEATVEQTVVAAAAAAMAALSARESTTAAAPAKSKAAGKAAAGTAAKAEGAKTATKKVAAPSSAPPPPPAPAAKAPKTAAKAAAAGTAAPAVPSGASNGAYAKRSLKVQMDEETQELGAGAVSKSTTGKLKVKAKSTGIPALRGSTTTTTNSSSSLPVYSSGYAAVARSYSGCNSCNWASSATPVDRRNSCTSNASSGYSSLLNASMAKGNRPASALPTDSCANQPIDEVRCGRLRHSCSDALCLVMLTRPTFVLLIPTNHCSSSTNPLPPHTHTKHTTRRPTSPQSARRSPRCSSAWSSSRPPTPRRRPSWRRS